MRNIFVIILLICSVVIGQEKKVTLEESLKIGLENSKEVRIAQAKIKYSQAQVDEVFSQMLPGLSLEAGYTRLSDIPPFQVNVPIFPNPITIQEPVLNSYNLKLSVKQPLFTGFRLSSLRTAAKLNSQAADVENSQVINEKALSIYKAFWNFSKAIKIKKLMQENLNSLSNHLKDTENFVKNGLATNNDLLKLKVQVANVQLNLIDASNAVLLAKSNFNRELGYEFDENISIIESEAASDLPDINYEELLNEAFRNRHELKSIGLKIEAGKQNISASGAGNYPQVFAFGDFYYSRPNQRIMPTEDKFNDTWDVGVGLQWNLWDWGNTSSKVTQAEQLVIQAENNFELLKEAVHMEVYNNFLRYNSSLEKVNVCNLAIESAEENYRITKEKYNEHIVTSSELIDAEVELINAKTNYNNALVDYKLAEVTLEKSAGRIIY